jgi:hypothetical protein
MTRIWRIFVPRSPRFDVSDPFAGGHNRGVGRARLAYRKLMTLRCCKTAWCDAQSRLEGRES